MELKDKIESKIRKNFTLNYFDTEQNRAIKDTFITFCKLETENNWFQGLKRLLENYSEDWKHESLSLQISDLREEIENLKKQKEQTKERPKSRTFGRKEELKDE